MLILLLLFSVLLHTNMNTCRYIVHASEHARTHTHTHILTHINALFLSLFCFPEENQLGQFAFRAS